MRRQTVFGSLRESSVCLLWAEPIRQPKNTERRRRNDEHQRAGDADLIGKTLRDVIIEPQRKAAVPCFDVVIRSDEICIDLERPNNLRQRRRSAASPEAPPDD